MSPQDDPIDGDAAIFWDAARDGRLMIKRCAKCAECFFYPRAFCPFCSHLETEWVAASGNATIYSFAHMRRRGEIVSTPALVTLDEGPTISSGLIGSPDAFRIGQRVRLRFERTEFHSSTPFFELVPDGNIEDEPGQST